MKRTIVIGVLLLALCLTACTQTQAETTTLVPVFTAPVAQQTTQAPEETTQAAQGTAAPEATAAPASEAFGFTLEGVTLVPGTAFDASLLPEAAFVYQVPSCAIEGTDNVYNYGAVEVTAFNDGAGEVIYSVFTMDANTSTDEGLYVGDSVARAEELYGTDYERMGNQLVYTRGGTMLILVLDGDLVLSIDFRWAA